MKAMILAGGKGTRVRPLTDTVPKPMIPIISRPVMEFLIDVLRQHGFDQIMVSTSYLADAIEAYFREGSRFGVQIGYSFEGKTVIPRRSFRALAALAELRDSGVDVLWVAGNHDCWGGEILREDVGVSYNLGPWEGSIAGWNVRIEHGDGLRDREDRGYRMIRPIMRHPVAIKAFRMLHPDWASRLAHGSSNASRTYRARDEGRGLRAYAKKQLEEASDLDLLVYGHSHVAALEQMENGRIFGNAGSWLDAPTFLRLTDEAVELRQWDGSAQGACLNSINR